MTPDEFQKACERTQVRSRDVNITKEQVSLLWAAIGVAGEGGEIAELAKKAIFHGHGIDVARWKEELGDLLWYVADCCSKLGLTIEEVMLGNVAKLAERFPDGFDPARTSGAQTPVLTIVPEMRARVDYTNYRGERKIRLVDFADNVPYLGSTEWHREPQWLISGWDIEKKAMRTFALASIHEWWPIIEAES